MKGHATSIGTRSLPWTHRNQAPLAIGLAALLLFGLHYFYGITEFPYDAGLYWGLSDPAAFGASAQTVRGYFFPLILSPLRLATGLIDSEPWLLYRLINSLLYGSVLTTVIPNLFVSVFGGTLSLSRRLIPVFLLAIIFPGVLLYPLSDLPAFLMVCGAVLCMRVAQREPARGKGRRFIFLGMAGFLGAAAYNTRTIYLFPVIVLFGTVLFWPGSTDKPANRLAKAVAFCMGMAVLSLPQAFINQAMQGKFTPLVTAEVSGRSLFASQLAWGITLQRYETNISKGYTNAGVFYLDPAGEALIKEIRKTQPMLSMSDYLKNTRQSPFEITVLSYTRLVLQHPLEFMGIYTRHAVNGLDVRDGLVYTQRFSTTRNGKSLLNFAVLALACWVVVLGKARSQADPHDAASQWQAATPGWPLWLALLLMPVVAIIPGAVETRFFLPLHLLAYCAIAFLGSPGALLENLRRRYVLVAGALAAGSGLFLAITLSTMASIHLF